MAIVVIVMFGLSIVSYAAVTTFVAVEDFKERAEEAVSGGVPLDSDGYHTLTKRVPGGFTYEAITFDGCSTGNAIVPQSVLIEGPASPSLDYLYIATLTLDGWRAQSLSITDSKVYSYSLENNRFDGQSITFTPSTATSDVVVGHPRGMLPTDENPGCSPDRIWIDGTAGNGTIGALTFTDLDAAAGGPLVIRGVAVGTLVLRDGVCGDGSGKDTVTCVIDALKGAGGAFNDTIDEDISVR